MSSAAPLQFDAAADRPAPALPVTQRHLWVDVARGIGILLVVYGHALRALFPTEAMPGWARLQDGLIYGFHMPLFFVASGLFLWRQIGRGRAPFLIDRLRFVVYPYFLWSLITGLLELLAAPFVNSPIHADTLLLLPLEPIEQYWFLYALLVVQLIAVAVYPSRLLLALLALVLPISLTWLGGELMVLRSFQWLPYLAAGVFAADALERMENARPAPLFALAAAAWLAFAAAYALPWPAFGPALRPYALGLTGTLGTFALGMLIARTSLVAPLAKLGGVSMAIFVTHTIASAGTRIGLVQLWPAIPVLFLLAITTVVGVVAPLALEAWARKRELLEAFGLGKDRRQARAVQ
jgi:fucose 4-O-acetylase-like acetyltransferase